MPWIHNQRILLIFFQKFLIKLSEIPYGFGIWDSRSGARKNLFRVPGQKKAPDPGSATLQKKSCGSGSTTTTTLVIFLARLTCAVCRKVFKEARALRYHQIHHPQLLATPPPAQQQQQHSVSANAPAMMNGFASSFLNGCDYELDNKSGIMRETNAQCGSGMIKRSEFFFFHPGSMVKKEQDPGSGSAANDFKHF